MLFRKADGGLLNLWGKVHIACEKMTLTNEADAEQGKEPFSLELSLLSNLKTLFLGIIGAVEHVREAQEIMLALADMAINVFALESSVLRAEKVFSSASDKKKELLRDVIKVVAFECSTQFYISAARCSGYAGLAIYRTMLRKNIQRLSYYPVEGLLNAKQLLAETAREAGRYTL
jgi:hypothetical protein